jgi:hypothetical protein
MINYSCVMMATEKTSPFGIPCVLKSTRTISIHEEPVESQQSEPSDSRQASIVPAACVACRTKHLKCDGEYPCSRCAVHKIECSYVKSRRGYKGPRKNQNQALKGVCCYFCDILNFLFMKYSRLSIFRSSCFGK